MSPKISRLYEALWPEEMTSSERLFAVLDGARDQRIFGAVDGSREDKCCLFSIHEQWPGHDLRWDLIGVAPYLVELEKGDDLTHMVLRHGWGGHWGIFCRTDARIGRVRRHFRDLLKVRTEAGRELMFRFYDPRVLRAYLPTCRPSELLAMFGPVGAFIVPGADPLTAVEYRLEGTRLVETIIGQLQAPPHVS